MKKILAALALLVVLSSAAKPPMIKINNHNTFTAIYGKPVEVETKEDVTIYSFNHPKGHIAYIVEENGVPRGEGLIATKPTGISASDAPQAALLRTQEGTVVDFEENGPSITVVVDYPTLNAYLVLVGHSPTQKIMRVYLGYPKIAQI